MVLVMMEEDTVLFVQLFKKLTLTQTPLPSSSTSLALQASPITPNRATLSPQPQLFLTSQNNSP
jgi:hypothetical protein